MRVCRVVPPPASVTYVCRARVIRLSRACRGLPNSQDGGKDALVAEVCHAEACRKSIGLVTNPMSQKDARGLLHTLDI